LVATVEALASEPATPGMKVTTRREDGDLWIELRLFRWRLLGVAGRAFAAFAGVGQRRFLEALLEREREHGVHPAELGLVGAPSDLLGAGHLRIDRELAKEIPGWGREVRFWMTRAKEGFVVDGVVR
jgi:hypothetical protein